MPRLTKKVTKKAPPKEPPAPDDDFIVIARQVARLAAEHKAKNVRAYDVRGLTVVADVLIICSAASEPQVRAIFSDVKERVKEAGHKPLHTEGEFGGQWLVIDFGVVIFHLFREEARGFYDLDGLWGDAPLLELDLQ